MDFTSLEGKIEYTFKRKELLQEAMTHRSYINENPSRAAHHNERLEFLGDAVLELVVTEELFKRYPDEAEGHLTGLRSALVNTHMLSRVAHAVQFGSNILLSKGEARDRGKAREVILANTTEALIGALHLDGGYEAAKDFIKKFVLTNLDMVIREGLDKDAKSELQEKTQHELKITPSYKVLKESGPDHSKQFTVGVYFANDFVAEGMGGSKQEAETAAARAAIEKIKK